MTDTEVAPPQGNVTFVFTDLVGSSQISKKLPYRDYEGKLLDPQFVLFSTLIVQHHGYECGTPAGDSVMAAFQSIQDALDCAIAMQHELTRIRYMDPLGTEWTLAARIGVHRAVVEVSPTTRGLYSSHPEANYAARIMSIAHAGQIIISNSARIAAGNRQEAFKSFPNRRLKDSEEQPQTVHELLYDGQEREEPGAQFIPGWFREQNQYIARPALENRITALFTQRTRNNSPYRLITLHGFGGMGKTRLAMQCCLNAAGLFDGRLFLARLDGISDEALSSDESCRDYLVASIVKGFALPDGTGPYQDLPERLPHGDSMLLMLDNYETVKGKASAELIRRLLEARPTLHILVTGRERVGLNPVEVVLEMGGLEPGEARELLIMRMREKSARFNWSPSNAEEQAINQILHETACIPLAIELVAAHSEEMTLSEIAAELAVELFGDMTATPYGSYHIDPSGRHETLEKCFHWSLRLLDREAQIALGCFSLFADYCSSEAVTSCFPAIKRSHLTRLQQASLIYRQEEDGQSLYSLLRPTREFAYKQLKLMDTQSALQRHFVDLYCRLLIDNGGDSNLEDPHKQAYLQTVWRHALAAAKVAADLKDDKSFVTLVDQLFPFFDRMAIWAEAEPFCYKVFVIRERALGSEHPETARSINNLAIVYEGQGKYDAAEAMHQRALAIREGTLGTEHPDTAVSLNNLAIRLTDRGEYAVAESRFQQALAIREKLLGEEHPDTAQTVNNLAFLYELQGNFADAKHFYERALAIYTKRVGKEHPFTATTINNLAILYHNLGDVASAEDLYKQALIVREKVLGTEHPETAQSLSNLAILYSNQGKSEVAEPLLIRALIIREKVLGVGHPETALSLNNLGMLYQRQGNYVSAELLHIRAKEIYERVLGAEHLDTAGSFSILGGLYNDRGDSTTAGEYYKMALKVWEKVLGTEHVGTASGFNNLAGIYETQGDFANAEIYYKRALKIWKKVFGSKHQHIASGLNNLGSLYEKQGKYPLAESLYNRALSLRKKVLEPGHPDTAISLNNLAGLYKKQGNDAAAEILYKRALEIWETVDGGNHKYHALSLNHLASIYERQGEFATSESLYVRALNIYENVLGAEHPTTIIVRENAKRLQSRQEWAPLKRYD